MEVKNMTNTELIERFENNEVDAFACLEEMMLRVIEKKVSQKAIEKLWELIEKRHWAQEDDIYIYILKEYVSRDFMVNRLLNCENEEQCNLLISKLGKLSQEEAEELIVSPKSISRKYAANYVNREIAKKMIFSEEDNSVLEILLKRLGRFSQEEADELITSERYLIREYACKYDLSRKVILQVLLVETGVYIICKLTSKLKPLLQEEANQLLKAKSYDVKLFATYYASREDILKQLFIEKDESVITEMFSYLNKGTEITEDEAKYLICSESPIVRQIVALHLSRETAVKQLLIEEDEDVSRYLYQNIGHLTEEEAETLLNEGKFNAKVFASRYVNETIAISFLLKEKDNHPAEIVDNLIYFIGAVKLNEQEAEDLITSKNWKIRNLAAKYLNRDIALERILVESTPRVEETLLKRIGNLSEKEAMALMKSRNDTTRLYASEFLSREDAFKTLLEKKDDYYMAMQLMKMVGDLSDEEAEKLITSKYQEVQEYAVDFLNRNSALKVVTTLKNSQGKMIRILLSKIGDLTQEEAEGLMISKNKLAKIHAVQYLEKSFALKYLMRECNDQTLQKELLKKIIE